MIKVTVILTTYNSEKTVQRTIDSVLRQRGRGTLFNISFIVVDDCSTDGTRNILRRNNLNYISTGINSGGPNKGRNIGLHEATGDFICFIDHDDTWEPEKMILQLRSAQYAPIVSTGYRTIKMGTDREVVRCKDGTEPVMYRYNETFLNILKKEQDGQHVYFSTLMISNDLKHILFEENFGMIDYDWLLRIFEKQKSIEIPRVLVTRYMDDKNLSLNEDYRKRDYYYSLFTLETYEKQYPKEVATGIKRVNGSRARYFYIMNNMQRARHYFKSSKLEPKTVGYYLTTFFGSSMIKRTFRVFG